MMSTLFLCNGFTKGRKICLCVTIKDIKNCTLHWKIIKNKVYLQLGPVRPSIRSYVRIRQLGLFVNLCMSEMSYRFQTRYGDL